MYIPTLDPKLVGEVIAQFRKKKGISQEVISGLADIGRTHLSAIERGERKPTLETLYRIANALSTTKHHERYCSPRLFIIISSLFSTFLIN